MNKILLAIVFLISSCNSDSQEYALIKLPCLVDSCYRLDSAVSRHFEIIENTLSDTIVLGGSIVVPKFIGSFDYLLSDTSSNFGIYPQTSPSLWSKTGFICISAYNRKNVKGYVTIKTLFENDKSLK